MCNKTLVMDRVKECFATAEAHFNTTFRMPNVRFDKRGRRMKRSPHGRNWKNIMMVLGVPADRCHSMDVNNARVGARRKTETFDYHCSGCDKTLPLGKIRHNKQMAGKADYYHCRGHKITFVG